MSKLSGLSGSIHEMSKSRLGQDATIGPAVQVEPVQTPEHTPAKEPRFDEDQVTPVTESLCEDSSLNPGEEEPAATAEAVETEDRWSPEGRQLSRRAPFNVAAMPAAIVLVAAGTLLRRRPKRSTPEGMRYGYSQMTPRHSVDVGAYQSPEDYGRALQRGVEAKLQEAEPIQEVNGAEKEEQKQEASVDVVIPSPRSTLSSLDWVGEVLFTTAITALVYFIAGQQAAVGMATVGLLRLIILEQRTRANSRRQHTEAPAAENNAADTEDGNGEAAGGPVGLSGVWRKDRAQSESMSEAMNLMRLNPVVRRAVGLINGLEIVHTEDEFSMAVLCVLPWFKVRENYPMNGESRSFKRRDLRKGQHSGRVTPHVNGVALEMSWSDPRAGTAVDVFTRPSPDVLHVHATVNVDGETATYLHVYHRRR